MITAGLFLLSACAPQNTTRPVPTIGSGSMMSATATPGTMIASPGSSHMMQPISGENIQQATEKVGGQCVAY